ncbi:hypothetical protein M0805_003490 [Coniferiporia weirii]|nr:hypothetical protein M0805_003490 [Coniferiporia weirii]
MRVYALYDKSKKIMLLMLIPFGFVVVASVYDLTNYAIVERATATPLAGIPNYCKPNSNGGGKTYIYWAQLLGFEMLLFALACVKAYKSYKTESEEFWGSGTSLAGVLIRDSVVYFFAIFAALVANVAVSPIDNGSLQEVTNGFLNAVSGIACQRLILNMRENYYSTCLRGRQSVFDITTWRVATVENHSDQRTGESEGSEYEIDSLP